MLSGLSEMGCAYYFPGDDVRGRAAHMKAATLAEGTTRKERLFWIAGNTAWVNTENDHLCRRMLREFIDEFPDDRDGYQCMGNSYLHLVDASREAIPWFEKAVEFTPGFFPTTRGATGPDA